MSANASASSVDRSAARTANPLLLVVDDEPTVRDFLTRYAESRGFGVGRITSGGWDGGVPSGAAAHPSTAAARRRTTWLRLPRVIARPHANRSKSPLFREQLTL